MTQSGQSGSPTPIEVTDADLTQTSDNGLRPVDAQLAKTRAVDDGEVTEASDGSRVQATLTVIANPANLINKKVGKYRILRLLGQGGMGAVFEALDSVLNRKVALKVLPADVTNDDKALKRFVREAQSAAALTHKNVVTVYDIAKVGEICFIVMELVVGKSAQDILATKGRLSIQEATSLMAEACRGLSAAHQAGLIHRDIKPGNILKAYDGTIKLSDFGLAKSIDSSANHYTITQQNAVLGTPKYMSPEQAQSEPLDGRSDIYSMGATYFALLTGQAPFNDGTVMQVLYAHCTKPIPDPRELCNDIPPACSQIIFKAMAKEPASRYQSADEMLADLETVLSLSQGHIPVAELATLEIASPVQPNQGLPQPSGLSSLGGMTMGTAAHPTMPQQEPAPSQPWYYDQNKQVAVAAGAVAMILAFVVGAIIFSSNSGGEMQVADSGVVGPRPIAAENTNAYSSQPGQPQTGRNAPGVTHSPLSAPAGDSFLDTSKNDQYEAQFNASREAMASAADSSQVSVEEQINHLIAAGSPDDQVRTKLAELMRNLKAAKAEGDQALIHAVAKDFAQFYAYFLRSPQGNHSELALLAQQVAEAALPGSTSDDALTFGKPPEGYFARPTQPEVNSIAQNNPRINNAGSGVTTSTPSTTTVQATPPHISGGNQSEDERIAANTLLIDAKFEQIKTQFDLAVASGNQQAIDTAANDLVTFCSYFLTVPFPTHRAIGQKAFALLKTVKPDISESDIPHLGPPPPSYVRLSRPETGIRPNASPRRGSGSGNTRPAQPNSRRR